MSWATFWAIFSQTHLAQLAKTHIFGRNFLKNFWREHFKKLARFRFSQS
jgi:hypothetical protein